MSDAATTLKPLVCLSLGAGVQSSTMALMAARGELGDYKVDAAIFADTGAEPKGVYAWLDWLETQLPFPVYRVSAGNLRDDFLSPGRVASIPAFSKSGGGLNPRQCTSEYKIVPINRKYRELLGLAKGKRGPKEVALHSLIGISLDEMVRMKASPLKYIENRWPLIELRMTRRDCLKWMQDRQYPMPSKSACTFCPYHDDAAWREMKANDPESWADAVAFDAAIRSPDRFAYRRMDNQLFIHRSCVPLSEVDLRTAEDMGQLPFQDFGFINECEGMCGV